jgi:hypothetical protein
MGFSSGILAPSRAVHLFENRKQFYRSSSLVAICDAGAQARAQAGCDSSSFDGVKEKPGSTWEPGLVNRRGAGVFQRGTAEHR